MYGVSDCTYMGLSLLLNTAVPTIPYDGLLLRQHPLKKQEQRFYLPIMTSRLTPFGVGRMLYMHQVSSIFSCAPSLPWAFRVGAKKVVEQKNLQNM